MTRSRLAALVFAMALPLVGGAAFGVLEAEAAEGARVRSILLESKDVFGPDERLTPPLLPDLTFVFRVANAIHFDTREDVIRRELLIREGDVVDSSLIAETERNLRDLPFVRDVRVYSRPIAGSDEVDLVVETQDTWTTEPRASFSAGGGEDKLEIGFIERNFLGYGKTIGIRYRELIDRSSTQFLYVDPRLFGSRWRWSSNLEDTSDGEVITTDLTYPFFSLETPYSAGVTLSDRTEENEFFDRDGNEVSEFDRQEQVFNIRGGMLIGPPGGRVVPRIGLFYQWLDIDFPDFAEAGDPAVVPFDRRRSEIGIFFRREVRNFVEERHFNVFDRVEDFNLGNIIDGQIGFASEALGSFENELTFTLLDRIGFDFGPGRKAFLFGLVTGRYGNDGLRNAVAEVEAISYTRFHWVLEHTLVARAKVDVGKNFDRDSQLFLGAQNGLRGFDVRQFVGNKRVSVNFEDRIFFVNDLFHLISLGAVLFVEAGTAWQGSDFDGDRIGGSFGFGLRVGTPRSAGEKIFRFDLAIPFTQAGDRQFEPAFLIGSSQAFSVFSGPFDLQTSSSGLQ